MNAKNQERLTDLGINLHTALRKCCDSEPTSLVYNLISIEAFDEAWLQYLGEVIALGEPVTVPKLKAAVKALEWGNAERNVLKLSLQAFSDDDWAGFIAFEGEEYAQT